MRKKSFLQNLLVCWFSIVCIASITSCCADPSSKNATAKDIDLNESTDESTDESDHDSDHDSNTELFLSPTIYYKPVIVFDKNKCLPEEIVEVLNPEDLVIAYLCKKDFSNCLMQGSCYIFDDRETFRSINYFARDEDGSPRFKAVNLKRCPFGLGVRNTCLDPYRTVAADLSIYKLGDVIFVPRVVGEIMPNGLPHDGFFVIRDAGGAIKGDHRFDFFTGFTRPFVPENTLRRIGFADSNNRFAYRMATEEEAIRIRSETHYPRVRDVIMLPPQLGSLTD